MGTEVIRQDTMRRVRRLSRWPSRIGGATELCTPQAHPDIGVDTGMDTVTTEAALMRSTDPDAIPIHGPMATGMDGAVAAMATEVVMDMAATTTGGIMDVNRTHRRDFSFYDCQVISETTVQKRRTGGEKQ